MNRALGWFAVVVLAFGAIAAYELNYFNKYDTSVLPKAGLYRITLKGVPLEVSLAQTAEERQQGLSGTKSLPQGQGMLFVFPEANTYSFWMKDMQYSIDIYWLRDDGRIVYMAEKISPETYPATYQSPEPVKYVLELPAGFAEAHGVRVGDVVHFQ